MNICRPHHCLYKTLLYVIKNIISHILSSFLLPFFFFLFFSSFVFDKVVELFVGGIFLELVTHDILIFDSSVSRDCCHSSIDSSMDSSEKNIFFRKCQTKNFRKKKIKKYRSYKKIRKFKIEREINKYGRR